MATIEENILLAKAFAHTYFELTDEDSDILDYIKQNSNKLMDYISQMRLHNMIGESFDFNRVLPQFRFVCERDYKLEIVRHNETGAYLRKGVPVYATNLFSLNEGTLTDYMMNTIMKNNDWKNDNCVIITATMYLCDGRDGFIVGSPYIDWKGMKLCAGTSQNNYTRLYLVGERMTKIFVEKPHDVPMDCEIKNYYKGTRLTKRKKPADGKNFVGNDKVFDMIENNLKSNVVFVQRDYIFDAMRFPDSLLNILMDEYECSSSVIKRVHKYDKCEMETDSVTIERYGINKYRVFESEINLIPPIIECYFVPSEKMLQIRHTLNAAYLIGTGIVIFADYSLFGARCVLDFEPSQDLEYYVKDLRHHNPSDLIYHLGGNYYLQQTQLGSNAANAFVIVRSLNLISGSRKLSELNCNWVLNTVLSLFVRKY
uniref:p49 n=1 Tax=Phthorimaea operculella granulovirus TaxID=192584 RepID=A0A1B2CRZ4_9BBAC|nr:P49 [Phthorimaea operculella granulovirus]QBH65848.1 P49 [Phthorimaea operculella granulovirus]QBH65978.1 P49 [Phthorimaea operculella granulovirus]QBH66628.1 P49 [Phthorimaea operculella granulovirus]QBH66758.1 P49 [Phthorimaea operculella granulovirus]